ncbi:MAG: hypothetical protein ACKVS9_08415 [Phycisphaerae bacterium]
MNETTQKLHEGKVVSVEGDKLTTTCDDGKQCCHTVAKDAKVTCDGQPSKVADLKTGTRVTVTPHATDKSIATAVTSKKPVAEPVAVS